MHRLTLAAGLVLVLAAPASAQSWAPWHQPSLLDTYGRNRNAAPPAPAPSKPKPRPPQAKQAQPASLPVQPASLTPGAVAPRPLGPDGKPIPIVADGGPRPEIAPKPPGRVSYQSSQPKGTIIIDHAARKLLLVQSGTSALAYPISVGREGFTWKGSERISRVADWPDWHPPAEMKERDPKLPDKMTGGLNNPLGAKALYLGNTLYRIHGTSDAKSIGRAASSGCFRMHNRHVVDLAGRVGIGTKVVVVNAPEPVVAQASPRDDKDD